MCIRDRPKAIRTLSESFAADPLYRQLSPEEELRKRLLPELFECDTEEMFECCDVFAEGPEVNGLIIVDDETEPYNPLAYYSTEAYYALQTDAYLIRDDLSLTTLWNFFLGRQYLNSRGTEELGDERLHIIYFAVRPARQGSGIAHKPVSDTHLLRSIEPPLNRDKKMDFSPSQFPCGQDLAGTEIHFFVPV